MRETYGPIDILALEFKGNHFTGEVLANLLDLIERQIVRVIDLVIVVKDKDGNVEVRELQQMAPDVVAIFNPLGAEVTEMITEEDAHSVGQSMENNSTAALMLFENLWAIGFKEAVLRANGRVIMQERIPHEVVQETLAEMAELRASA
jgi:uncharacterized membrane protein